MTAATPGELPSALVLSEPFAGLRAQAVGLASAAGWDHRLHDVGARGLWRRLPPRFWPQRVCMGEAVAIGPTEVVISVGGKAAAVAAAMRGAGAAAPVVQVQNPRQPLERFDLVVVNRHDEIDGRNVLVSRTAIHGIGPGALAAARAIWAPRLAHLPRPLVTVLVGGANGRFRFGVPEAQALAADIRVMMGRDGVGVALTPSRRTGAAQAALLREAVVSVGGWVWDMQGDNPYLGLLACADAIVVTMDSVSMVSEAVATEVPVLVRALPGRSRRIGLFLRTLIDDGRVRPFTGRFEAWTTQALNDTPMIAAEMGRRLGLPLGLSQAG